MGQAKNDLIKKIVNAKTKQHNEEMQSLESMLNEYIKTLENVKDAEDRIEEEVREHNKEMTDFYEFINTFEEVKELSKEELYELKRQKLIIEDSDDEESVVVYQIPKDDTDSDDSTISDDSIISDITIEEVKEEVNDDDEDSEEDEETIEEVKEYLTRDMIETYLYKEAKNIKGELYNTDTMKNYIAAVFKNTIKTLNFTDNNVYHFFNDINKINECFSLVSVSVLKKAGKTMQLIYEKFYNVEYKQIAECWTKGTAIKGLIETQNKKVMKPISIANEQMEKLEVDLQILKEEFEQTEEIDIKTYKQMLMLDIIKNVGVLRPKELQCMQIIDNEEAEIKFDNYINIKTQKMVIGKHKNSKYETNEEGNKICTNKRIINLPSDFCKLCEFGVNTWLISDEDGNTINKKEICNYLKELLNIKCKYYELRRMKTSVCVKSGDMELINKLAYNQGHDIQTQLTYYTTYA